MLSNIITITIMTFASLAIIAWVLSLWFAHRARKAYYAKQDEIANRRYTPTKRDRINQDFENWDAQFENRPAKNILADEYVEYY